MRGVYHTQVTKKLGQGNNVPKQKQHKHRDNKDVETFPQCDHDDDH